MSLRTVTIILWAVVTFGPPIYTLWNNWRLRPLGKEKSFTLNKGERVNITSDGTLTVKAWASRDFALNSSGQLFPASKFSSGLYLLHGPLVDQEFDLYGSAGEAHIEVLEPEIWNGILFPNTFQKVGSAVFSLVWLVIWGLIGLPLLTVQF